MEKKSIQRMWRGSNFERVFWLYHVFWWGFLVCLEMLRHIEHISTETSVEIILLYGAGSVAGLILHVFFRKLDHRSIPLVWLFGIIIASSIMASYIWNAVVLSIDQLLRSSGIVGYDLAGSLRLFGFSFFYSVLLITYSGLYFTLKIWIDLVDQRIKVEKAESLRRQAQLQMLRYQINPHFIFNSLCSLRALVESEKAELMVTKLSEFLRYTLDGDQRDEVPLDEEIKVATSYLDIEKVRFGERLTVHYNIDDASRERIVPGFMLNTLVENAVKHGFRMKDAPLVIDINSDIREDGTLVVEVVNNGRLGSGSGREDGVGVGLCNMEKRLDVLYPGSYSFDIFEESGRVHARISLPDHRG